jgi:cytochrome c oxidase subunit 4
MTKKSHKIQHATGSFSVYIYTWIALVILALVSISLAAIDTGVSGIVMVISIASVKAGLILYFFMHLRHEGWFFKLAFLLPILVFAFSLGFTFLDVLYR